MPRKPHPHAKISQLIIRSSDPIEERKIQAVKEIVARNSDLTIKTAMMPGIDLFLRKHNWPPGDSQTLIEKFTHPTKLDISCQWPNCHQLAVYKDLAKTGNNVCHCRQHHEVAMEKGLIKSSQLL